MTAPPRIVLASASPRRSDLLRRAGVAFEVLPADVDETIQPGLPAGEVARDLALRKAVCIRERLRADAGVIADAGPGPARPIFVLGSDTLVVLGDDESPDRRFLEKAADGSEASSMLRALSGSRHRVITGVAVATLHAGRADLEVVDHETTFVSMRELREDEIAAYVASGEWRGKAGSYAIQESADRFVTAVEGGGFDNVVGLPVARTLRLLREAQSRQASSYPT